MKELRFAALFVLYFVSYRQKKRISLSPIYNVNLVSGFPTASCPHRVRVPILYNEKSPTPLWVSDFIWRAARDKPTWRLTARRPHGGSRLRTTSLKNNRLRLFFLTLRALTGFESLSYIMRKVRHPYGYRTLSGAPQGTRTPDLLVRSQTLYPAELAAHSCLKTAKI